MKRLTIAAAAWAVSTTFFCGLTLAADNDPSGTWKWSITFNNQTREATLKLKLEGDQLTGAMLGRDNQETPIENASYKEGEVAFSVTRERNNQKFTSHFKGKVTGDTIKGTIEFERNGEKRSRDWEAKREKS